MKIFNVRCKRTIVPIAKVYYYKKKFAIYVNDSNAISKHFNCNSF